MFSILFKTIIFGVLTLLPNHIQPELSSDGDGTKTLDERKLTVSVNPGCSVPDFCNSGNGSLVHIRSDSATDSLHFVWNFFGRPTLLLARTDLTTNLTVDWVSLILGKTPSVSFDPPEVLNSFGTTIATIWTFDDKLDQVELDKVDQNHVYAHDTKDFLWKIVKEDFVSRSDLIQFSHVAREYNGESLGSNGYVNITVKVRSTDDHSDILPYMLHNGNSSQVDISLNGMTLNNTLTSTSRIGLGYLFVQQLSTLHNGSNGEEKTGIKVYKTKETDDEHSPGVLDMLSLRTPLVNSHDQSYLEWKPVGYTSQVRDVTDSIDVHVYPVRDESEDAAEELLRNTLLWSFYGNNVSTLIVQTANITFGSQGDGFYNKKSHISWTYMTGMELNKTTTLPIEAPVPDHEQILSPPHQEDSLGVPEATTADEEANKTAEDEDNRTIDTSKTAEIPSFSEWTKLQLSKKQETLLQVQTNGLVKEKEGKKEDGKNFASPDCGAKILVANPEAQNPYGILSTSHDEYMLNRCGVSSWFVIELCDSIKLEKISIGNLELFSSSPKDIEVGVSDRYPTRDWVKIGPLELPDARAIHSFPIPGNSTFSKFAKFIRIQILSNHGHEHYCPVSVIRIYGKSEFDVMDAESAHGDMDHSDHGSPISKEKVDSIGDAQSKESVIKIAADAMLNMVKNAAQVLVKRDPADGTDGRDAACQSTTNCLVSPELQKVNVTEVCNLKLLYFIQAHSNYFSKNSSCKAIFNSYSIGSPSQVDGFWRALFGDRILQMVCSYTSPLQICSNEAALSPSVEGINSQTNGVNGNLTLKPKTDITLEQNGGNLNQQAVAQEPIDNSNNNNVQQQQPQQPIPPIQSEIPGAADKTPVVEEESRTQNKESVFVRLTNRIKTLERNQSLSSGYLEELSQRFKKQSEESYTISQNLKKSLNETAGRYKWLQEFSRRESNYLRRSVTDLRDSLWKTDMQRGFLIFMTMVQFIGMLLFCCWTRRRISSLEDRLQTSLHSLAAIRTAPFDHSGRVRLSSSESQQHPIVPRKRSNSHPDVMKPKKKKKKKELLKQSVSNAFHFISPSKQPTVTGAGGEGNSQNQPPSTTTTSSKSTAPTVGALLAAATKLSTSSSVLLTSGQILQDQESSNLNSNSYPSNLKSSNVLLERHSDPSSINRFGILASPGPGINSFSSVSSPTTADTSINSSITERKSKGKKLKLKNFMPKLFDK